MNLIIETERLLMREFLPTDADAFLEMEKNPEVHKYLENKPITNIEEIQNAIRVIRQQYLDNYIGRFAVILKETDQFIGWAGLKYNTKLVNNKNHFYDIGYRLNENFWGKGYASEASLAWLNYGFNTMNIQTMTATAHIENVASNRILQKIGMKMTEQYLEDNVYWNWYEIENSILK